MGDHREGKKTTRPTGNSEASGSIEDLLAAEAGFGADWGFSRWIIRISRKLLTPAWNIDWRSADGWVAAALAKTLAAPSDRATVLPQGVERFGPMLVQNAAVSQRWAGWAAVPGHGERTQRLVEVRCHFGKRQLACPHDNVVLVQYRVWIRTGDGVAERIVGGSGVRPLLEDLHAEIERQLTE